MGQNFTVGPGPRVEDGDKIADNKFSPKLSVCYKGVDCNYYVVGVSLQIVLVTRISAVEKIVSIAKLSV